MEAQLSSYWIASAVFLACCGLLGLLVPPRLRVGAAVSVGILGLFLLVPIRCSQLSGLGVPAATVVERPPRCKTGFDVPYLPPFDGAGWFDVGIGVLITLGGVAAFVLVGRVRRRSTANDSDPTSTSHDSTSETGT